MAFDGIITKVVVNELNKLIINSRVEKIYQPNNNEVWFYFHANRITYKLLISIDAEDARIHFSEVKRENPIKAMQFCMVLRKYLQGAKVINISQYLLDRIVEITFENIDELGDLNTRKLVIEIMGKHSNIILLNQNGKIIDSIKHIDVSMSSLREVLPAREYTYPTNQNRASFIGMSIEQFIESVNDSMMRPAQNDVAIPIRIANEFMGFSRTFTYNLCEFLKIDTNEEIITINKIKEMYNTLILLFYNISQENITLTNIGNDYHINLNDFSIYDELTPISDFLDKYYIEKGNRKEIRNIVQEMQRVVSTHIGRIQKKLDIANKNIEESFDAEKYRQYGELIYSNIQRIEKGANEVSVENYYDNNNILVIQLEENWSPSKNSQYYFKKYTKLRNTLSHSIEQKKSYEKELEYLETINFQINECENVNDILEIKEELINGMYIKSNDKSLENSKKKAKKQVNVVKSEPIKYELDGIEILVGKNNIQNDRLTFKHAKKTYTWLHTKDIHGSHVIIKSDNIPDNVLEYAASMAAKHSKAKGQGKVQVDYTLVKNVRKPSGAKPGMVIYNDYKTIVVE